MTGSVLRDWSVCAEHLLSSMLGGERHEESVGVLPGGGAAPPERGLQGNG